MIDAIGRAMHRCKAPKRTEPRSLADTGGPDDGERGSEREAQPRARGARRDYFLWRCRFSSLRCLCLRIFLRRFLMTLPTGYLLAPDVLGARLM